MISLSHFKTKHYSQQYQTYTLGPKQYIEYLIDTIGFIQATSNILYSLQILVWGGSNIHIILKIDEIYSS
jgi:hypothetical protein